MLRPLSLILHERNAVPARMGDPRDIDHDDRPPRFIRWKFPHQFWEFWRIGFDNPAHTVQAKNVRTSLKLTEHDHNPAILFQVRNGLNTTTDHVEIGDGPRPKNAKRIEAFRRKIQCSTGVEGRGRHEKHML